MFNKDGELEKTNFLRRIKTPDRYIELIIYLSLCSFYKKLKKINSTHQKILTTKFSGDYNGHFQNQWHFKTKGHRYLINELIWEHIIDFFIHIKPGDPVKTQGKQRVDIETIFIVILRKLILAKT